MEVLFKGELKFKGEIQEVSETFKKRDIWVEIDQDTQYPQTIKFELTQDKCSLVDKYTAATKTTQGDQIELDVNIRGRLGQSKKTGKWDCYNQLNPWRIRGMASGEVNDAPLPAAESAPAPEATQVVADMPGAPTGGKDDLPF